MCGYNKIIKINYLILCTHHKTVMLENVHFAHWARSMLEQPRVDAALVELVPEMGFIIVLRNRTNGRRMKSRGSMMNSFLTFFFLLLSSTAALNLPAWQHTNDIGYFVRFNANRTTVAINVVHFLALNALGRDLGDDSFRH